MGNCGKFIENSFMVPWEQAYRQFSNDKKRKRRQGEGEAETAESRGSKPEMQLTKSPIKWLFC